MRKKENPFKEKIKIAMVKKGLNQTKMAKNDFVINIGQPDSRYTKDFLTALYPKICKRAGVKSFLHKLRHTFASQLVQNGVDLYTVSKLLGHRTIQMTEIYAHLAPQTLQDAIKKLPKIG